MVISLLLLCLPEDTLDWVELGLFIRDVNTGGTALGNLTQHWAQNEGDKLWGLWSSPGWFPKSFQIKLCRYSIGEWSSFKVEGASGYQMVLHCQPGHSNILFICLMKSKVTVF